MKNKINKEIHLFIIWEKAREHEIEIIEDIQKKFKIIQTFSITWSPYNISRNFTRFYGQKLPKNSHKELHCGKGEFKLIIIEDNNPLYDYRETSSGNRFVNINMFDLKMKYRQLTGGGHKIHGTDNIIETRHDIVLLTGFSIEDFLSKYSEYKNNIELKQDLIGTNGWKSFDELFYTLNECSEYIILRNYQNINLNYISVNKGDIDLLVKNRIQVCHILGDIEGVNNKNNHLKIDVNKNIILFEVYETGENLFHEKFENDLFKYKEKTNFLYHPNKEMDLFALIYHALLLNIELSEKHKKRINNEINKFSNFSKLKIDESSLIKELNNFFIKHNYYYIAPDNINIYFNDKRDVNGRLQINKKRRWNILKHKISRIIEISVSKKTYKLVVLRPIPNIFSMEVNIKYLPNLIIMLGNKSKY